MSPDKKNIPSATSVPHETAEGVKARDLVAYAKLRTGEYYVSEQTTIHGALGQLFWSPTAMLSASRRGMTRTASMPGPISTNPTMTDLLRRYPPNLALCIQYMTRKDQNSLPLLVISRYATRSIRKDNMPMVEYRQIFCMKALRSISCSAIRASSVMPRISPSCRARIEIRREGKTLLLYSDKLHGVSPSASNNVHSSNRRELCRVVRTEIWFTLEMVSRSMDGQGNERLKFSCLRLL